MNEPYPFKLNKMYKKPKFGATTLKVNDSTEGETIEMKVMRIVNNGEPMDDGAETIYTERKDGVIPAYNIKTDRFELAIEAMDVGTRSAYATRQENIDKRAAENGETESTGGTNTEVK